MCRLLSAVLLAAAAFIPTLASGRLNSTYSTTRTQDTSLVSLRVDDSSSGSPTLFTFNMHGNFRQCKWKADVMYNGLTGKSLQATITNEGVTVRRVGQQGDVGAEGDIPLLRWKLGAGGNTLLKIVTATSTISLDKEMARILWLRLWAKDLEADEATPDGDLKHPYPDEGDAETGRGVVYAVSSIGNWVDVFLDGDRHRLVTLSFRNEDKLTLEIPLLSMYIETEHNVSERKETYAAEVKSLESGASLKFIHEETAAGNRDKDEASGNTEENHVCKFPASTSEKEHEGQSGHEDNLNFDLESLMKGPRHETRQNIISSVYNLSSNMTTFNLADGGRFIHILQKADLGFCPRQSWTLNQVFRFRSDGSGWEYVVSPWEFGVMVVKGEWGASFLQWYQKTFAISFDQNVPFPSTHLVLDFRNRSTFNVWLRWPERASALKASLTVRPDSLKLLVEEVDEFRGEKAAVEVGRVEVKSSSGGTTFDSIYNASRIRTLYNSIMVDLLTTTSPEMCGEVPEQDSLDNFLRRLLNHSPTRLWDQILKEGRRLVLGTGSRTPFQHLWEALKEEFGIDEAEGEVRGVLKLWWAWLEQVGVVTVPGEGQLKVVIRKVWLEIAKDVLVSVTEGGPECHAIQLLERMADMVMTT